METTLDTICRGELHLRQPRDGYRFNVDSVILAAFAADALPDAPRRVVDLGAGCGVVGLLLARRWARASVLLVELQPELATLAQRNALENGLADRVEVRCLDLREADRWRDPPPDLVICNPPFFRATDGRVSPKPQVRLAKHELACSLAEVVEASGRALAEDGALVLIQAAERERELEGALEGQRLHATRLRRVVPLPDRAASRILLLARRAGSPLRREDDLLIEERPGVPAPEMRRILGD
jgi:tRNA1Val (adenine37-N6)-methyltransferase